MTTPKAPITCHVLDTTTGRPASNLAVTLTNVHHAQPSFHSVTNNDGRIMTWQATEGSQTTIESLIQAEPTTSVWKLTFKTGDYYGLEKTFWPVVDLTFAVKAGEHYHVPLLLGPFSYTTYRGS